MSKKANFDRREVKIVAKFLFLSGKGNDQIHRALGSVVAGHVVCLRTIQRYTARFGEGDFSVEDKPKSGRPRAEIDVDEVQRLLDEDPHISAREMAKRIGVSKDLVCDVLKNQVMMYKVRTKWVPHELSGFQKEARVMAARDMLEVLGDSKQHHMVYTQDESWVRWENPRKSMWLKRGSRPPTSAHVRLTNEKRMVSVIFNSEGIVSIVFLPRGEGFNKDFFENVVMEDFVRNVQIPRTRDKTRKIKFHCDNSTSHLIDDTFQQLNVPRLKHPPYSPDLAPCDFFLFGYMKMCLEGSNFKSDEELIEATSRVLESIPHYMFANTYREWVERLRKCIELGGEYVE
jgi:histone-lysine N-methyltransferase SETMAR